MILTFNELRGIKHQLPTGSIKKIANKLELDEQTVRNYFGAKKYEHGQVVALHKQPGPDGGIVNIQDDRIINMAMNILSKSN